MKENKVTNLKVKLRKKHIMICIVKYKIYLKYWKLLKRRMGKAKKLKIKFQGGQKCLQLMKLNLIPSNI